MTLTTSTSALTQGDTLVVSPVFPATQVALSCVVGLNVLRRQVR
jgi:hypothetical protein